MKGKYSPYVKDGDFVFDRWETGELGCAVEVDADGYDSYGYDANGRDRAYHTEDDYLMMSDDEYEDHVWRAATLKRATVNLNYSVTFNDTDVKTAAHYLLERNPGVKMWAGEDATEETVYSILVRDIHTFATRCADSVKTGDDWPNWTMTKGYILVGYFDGPHPNIITVDILVQPSFYDSIQMVEQPL